MNQKLRAVISPLMAVVLGFLAMGVAGCGDDPTGPEFEVIEETTFAASLNVDLAAMTRLGSGVYIEDLAVGGGRQVEFGLNVTIEYQGWLTDGTEFVPLSSRSFLMGNGQVVLGLEDGVLAQRVGGSRRIVIPPNRGFAGQGLLDGVTGAVVVPPGAVLVYEVTILDVVDVM